MKKNIYILLATLLFAITSGCNSILDIKPTTFISDEAIWKDKNLINQFVANIYGSMQSGFTRYDQGAGQTWSAGFGGNFDSGSDDYDPKFDSKAINLGRGSISSLNCPFVEELWVKHYQLIYKTNTLIQNLTTIVGDDVMSPRERALYSAEVRFLRAFCYFELAKVFGAVPLITTIQTLEDNLLVPASSFEEIVQFVVDECDDYSGDMNLTETGTRKGHAARGAFLSLKSRALLYLASPLNNLVNTNSRWKDAADAAKDVIDLGVYSLSGENNMTESKYHELFIKGDDNEFIFERRYRFPEIVHNTHMFWSCTGDKGDGAWNGLYPTQNLIDAFETTDGKLITDPTSIYDPQNPYANRDLRLQAIAVTHNSYWESENGVAILCDMSEGGSHSPSMYRMRCGYGVKKFIEELPINTNLYGSYSQSNSWPFFRFAEILLNYAEALNEYESTPSQQVYDAVNRVRARANQPNLPTSLSKAEMRIRIRNERRVELNLEEHRFFDVRRWKQGELLNQPISGMKITKTTGGGFNYEVVKIDNRVFSDDLYFLPIPQAELDKNPNLKK